MPGIWQDTVAKVPQSPRAHSNLGAVLILVPDRVNDAVVEYAAAARLQPHSGKAHNDLGNVLGHAGRLEESRAEYEEAIRCDPDLADAHESLGTVWMTLRQPEKALVEYQATERLRPNSPGAHNDLGNALYYKPGHMADAIAEYHEALRLDPNFSEAHGNLGNALLTQPGQLENAVAEYETSIRLKPGFAGAHVCLAVALLLFPGRGAEARTELETALRLHPGGSCRRLGGVLASLPPASAPELPVERPASLRLAEVVVFPAGRMTSLARAAPAGPGLCNDDVNLLIAQIRTYDRLIDALEMHLGRLGHAVLPRRRWP